MILQGKHNADQLGFLSTEWEYVVSLDVKQVAKMLIQISKILTDNILICFTGTFYPSAFVACKPALSLDSNRGFNALHPPRSSGVAHKISVSFSKRCLWT